MKKGNVISILLCLLGIILFIISNSSVTSNSLIELAYYQRIILCSIAVVSIAIAPFVYKATTVVGTIIKFMGAVVLIYCIFAFKGFEDNRSILALVGCGKKDAYEIEITVPAGSTEEFVYSDEEIRPTGNKITILSGAGLGDTEVILKPVNENVETGYVAEYLTHGVPVKFDTSNVKDEWFKIGVSVQNNSDRGAIAVSVEVEGVEVRIADKAEQWDLIPMVMVNGELYLDTGHESSKIERTDHFDGEITSEVDGSKQPTENNQSNFGTGYGYQYGSREGIIEIYMNESWRIFATEEVRQKLQFPEVNDTDEVEENWGITLSVENITSTGATIKCTQSGGEPTGELQTGSWYIVENWTQESGWKEMPYIIQGNIGWTAEAWMIPAADKVEWEVNWEWLYGELPTGKYRIGKEIMDFRASGDFDKAIYFAEFIIE